MKKTTASKTSRTSTRSLKQKSTRKPSTSGKSKAVKKTRAPKKTKKTATSKSKKRCAQRPEYPAVSEHELTSNTNYVSNPNDVPTQGIEQSFTSFFYSDDKFVNQFEDDEITKFIQLTFPIFKSADADDSITKKTIISILENVDFMEELLNHYNMTIFDFFRYLYRQESSLFKTVFIQRIQRALSNVDYSSFGPSRNGRL